MALPRTAKSARHEAPAGEANRTLAQVSNHTMMKTPQSGVRLAMLVVGLGAIQAAWPAGPAGAMPDFATARAQFEAGRAGSGAATERAQQLFSRLLGSDANNPLYLAYYGSTFTLQARDTRAPWTKIKLVNQGTSLLDRALGLLEHTQGGHLAGSQAEPVRGPAALETRLVAMATFLALPELVFHRLGAAKREYQRAVNSPDYAAATPDLQGHLQYEGALIAREEGDMAAERAALERVLALAPPSIKMAEVHARLGELR